MLYTHLKSGLNLALCYTAKGDDESTSELCDVNSWEGGFSLRAFQGFIAFLLYYLVVMGLPCGGIGMLNGCQVLLH